MKGAIFRGIPYAHHRRRTTLEPPQPMPRWTMPDATRFGPVCLNPRAKAGGTPARARTAFPINIATPSLPPAKRPALMLIYGGAFSAGSGAELFDEAAMVFNPRGILLVSLNYRLGRLGFFSHPACGRSSPACPPATWPMDQVAALRWVKAKVGRFGGDPAKVTIMGCSAGGARINALVATHAARGLLARASAHSSGGTNNAIRPPQAQAEREGLVFAARAGVAATDKSAIAALRRVDPATILAADPGPPNFGAVVDGATITQESAIAFARGEIARVAYIAGSISNEASVFGLMGFDEDVFQHRLAIDFAEVRRVYDPQARHAPAQLPRQVQTDLIFTAAATATAVGRTPATVLGLSFRLSRRGARRGSGRPSLRRYRHRLGAARRSGLMSRARDPRFQSDAASLLAKAMG